MLLTQFKFSTFSAFSDMSATAFFEPLPVIDFVAQLLNTDIHSRPLSDAERVKVCLATPRLSTALSLAREKALLWFVF